LKITVMMLTCNSAEYLSRGVLSGLKNALRGYGYRIIFIDSGNNIDTLALMARNFPNMVTCWISPEHNLAKLRNILLQEALKENADMYAFVDSDVIVPENFFKRLVPLFHDPAVGSAEIHAHLMHHHRTLVTKYFNELRNEEETGLRECEGGATTCILIKPCVAKQLHMDPRFSRAGEDVDLHYKINELGYRTLVDFNKPYAKHIRNPTFRAEASKLPDKGEARLLNTKLHGSVIRGKIRRSGTILRALGTFLMFSLLITIPVLLAQQAHKLKHWYRLDLAGVGLIFSLLYHAGVIRGALRWR